jgi:hypothetical protein
MSSLAPGGVACALVDNNRAIRRGVVVGILMAGRILAVHASCQASAYSNEV